MLAQNQQSLDIVGGTISLLISITQFLFTPLLDCSVEEGNFELVKLLGIHFDHQVQMGNRTIIKLIFHELDCG
jgi:hypothetical protein